MGRMSALAVTEDKSPKNIGMIVIKSFLILVVLAFIGVILFLKVIG